jgi:hypothetical protein
MLVGLGLMVVQPHLLAVAVVVQELLDLLQAFQA